MVYRLIGISTLLSAVLSFSAVPVQAQNVEPKLECAAKEISRTGRPGRTKLTAKVGARNAWREKVVNRKKLGRGYSAWHNAIKKDDPYNCFRKRFKKRKRWVCKATAKPCKSLIVWHSPGRVCSPYQYNGTGKAHKYEFIAKNKARKVWKKLVKQIVGRKFDTWTYSHSKDYKCTEKDGKYTCTAKAKPCKISLNPFKDEKTKIVK